MKAYAQDLGDITISGPSLEQIVGGLLTLALIAAALFFLVQLILGGIMWINAGGDPKALDAARSRITNAVIGLIIVVASFAIAYIVTNALGVNIFTGDEIKFRSVD